MSFDVPSTPRFDRDLERALRREAAAGNRTRRPFTSSSLRRLRIVSAMAGHVGAAVAISTVFLLLSPATLDRQAALPPIAEPPATGYVAQYGISATDRTITLAREAGFEVDVITTFVADRAANGAIVTMRHLSNDVTAIPTDDRVRGPLLIVIGLTIGDAGATAD